MTAIRKSATTYTDQERRVLLTGVPVSCMSTRFGHWKTGWDIAEIRTGWELLGDELLEEWEAPEFDAYRERGPFAERVLDAELEDLIS